MKKGNNLSLRDMYDMLSGTLQGVREDRARVKAINAELVEALDDCIVELRSLHESANFRYVGDPIPELLKEAEAALKKARGEDV